MPARNPCHDAVIRALESDGWTITDDPLKLEYGDRNLFVDLGAECSTLGAERSGRKIAVEIRSFLGPSALRDLEEAVGQDQVYRRKLTGGRMVSSRDPMTKGLRSMTPRPVRPGRIGAITPRSGTCAGVDSDRMVIIGGPGPFCSARSLQSGRVETILTFVGCGPGTR